MEETNQDVESVESSATETAESPAQAEGTATAEASTPSGELTAASEGKPEEKEPPFHEHPRFREVIEQKNQAAEKARQLELQFAKLQAQFDMQQRMAPKEEPFEDKALKRLAEIDPDLAKVVRDAYSKGTSVDKVAKELEEFKEWRANQEHQSRRQMAETKLSSLHTQYKVPKELQDFYSAQVKAQASINPQLELKDLDGLYKSIHDKFNGYMENVRRQDRAGYVAAKKTDASAPAPQPKGQAPGTAKQKYSDDPEQAKGQLIKNVIKQARAAKDL